MGLKGIILAGGSGTRLHPVTLGVSKQLLPIYDKPMVYYPLVHADAGRHPGHPAHLDSGRPAALSAVAGRRRQWGISLSYAEQPRPKVWRRHSSSAGISSAPTAWRSCSATTSSMGTDFRISSEQRPSARDGATVFAYHVKDPERYGVVPSIVGLALDIEEKPASRNPISL